MGEIDRLEGGRLGNSQYIVRIKKSGCLFLWYHPMFSQIRGKAIETDLKEPAYRLKWGRGQRMNRNNITLRYPFETLFPLFQLHYLGGYINCSHVKHSGGTSWRESHEAVIRLGLGKGGKDHRRTSTDCQGILIWFLYFFSFFLFFLTGIHQSRASIRRTRTLRWIAAVTRIKYHLESVNLSLSSINTTESHGVAPHALWEQRSYTFLSTIPDIGWLWVGFVCYSEVGKEAGCPMGEARWRVLQRYLVVGDRPPRQEVWVGRATHSGRADQLPASPPEMSLNNHLESI